MIKTTDKPLTLKQEQFVANYLESSNAYQAAIKAGYKETTAIVHSGHMLENVRIKAEIDKKRQEIADNMQITVESQIEWTKKLRAEANKSKRLSAALTANDQLNRHINFYDKDNQSSRALTPIQVVITGSDKPIQAQTQEIRSTEPKTGIEAKNGREKVLSPPPTSTDGTPSEGSK